MTPILVIQYPDGREDSYPVTAPMLTVGSAPSCDVAVQEPGIAPELFRLLADGSRFFVERIVSDGALSLNGKDMGEKELFPIGGVIRVAGIKFLLRPPQAPQSGAGIDSPDGTAQQADQVRAELGTGWRGYRQILAWLSATVSPAEAERAESVFKVRRLLFVACLSFAILLLATVIGAETLGLFSAVTAVRRVLLFFVFLSSIFLRARNQISFAGRALFLVAVPSFFVDPPDIPAAEANIMLDVWWPAGVLCAFLAAGWAVDLGAAVFRSGKRRVALRWTALVLCAIFVTGAEFLFQKGVIPSWSDLAFLILPFAGLALAAIPRIRAWLCRSKEIADVENVVEVAFAREAKTFGGRSLALAGVSGVALLLLLALNGREAMDWRSRKDALVIDTEFGERPWFWEETRSYLAKADFDQKHVFFLPESDLLTTNSAGINDEDNGAPSWRKGLLQEARRIHLYPILRDWNNAHSDLSEEELAAEWKTAEPTIREERDLWALSPLGERIGTLLDAIDDNPDDATPYESLLSELAPFRKTSEDADWIAEHLGTDVVVIHASQEKMRPSVAHQKGRTFHQARLRLGAKVQDPVAIDLISFRIQASLFPCLISVVLAFLFLWSRGGDSKIGFWIGIFLVCLAFSALFLDFSHVLEDTRDTDFADVSENLTRHALLAFHSMSETSALGAVARFFFLLIYGGAWVSVFLSGIAQPILFLLLCWPMAKTGGCISSWTKRLLKFFGATIVPMAIGAVFNIFVNNIFVARLLVVAALVIAGFHLRHKTRELTEAKCLGWEFAAAWGLIEASVYLTITAFSKDAGWLRPTSVPFCIAGFTTTPAFLLCAATSILSAVLCFRMCLRRGFLQMLTPARLTFAIFAVAIPCLAELSEQLIEKVFEGSILSSQLGDEMLGILVVVLLFAPCWDVLCNRLRRLSVRHLPKVERSAEQALEALLDEDPSFDFRDALHAAFAAIPLQRYAFYARTSSRSFALVASKDASPNLPSAFDASRHLQRRLANVHAAVDLSTIAYDRSLFFQSFELHRIGASLAGGPDRPPVGIILPIRLGHSLRGILFAPAEGGTGMPELSNEEVSQTVNDLGLATIASARNEKM